MIDVSQLDRVLDVGGWRKPDNRATHVADRMPYETRWTRLNTKPLPCERFSKDTWPQIDFLDSGLRFPFADNYFD
ncbi:MAG: hypothetical protein GY788_31430 [bacterium]|nr:hypothetical protein [bacterium]